MLYRQDLVGLEVDDCCDQVTFVGEVVIHLRSAHRGGFLNVLDGGACHSVLVHQFGGGGDDPSSSSTPLGGQFVWCSGGIRRRFLESRRCQGAKAVRCTVIWSRR